MSNVDESIGSSIDQHIQANPGAISQAPKYAKQNTLKPRPPIQEMISNTKSSKFVKQVVQKVMKPPTPIQQTTTKGKTPESAKAIQEAREKPASEYPKLVPLKIL